MEYPIIIYKGALPMESLYELLRNSLAGTSSSLLGESIYSTYIDCAPEGCAARSAAPLTLGADANEWANVLNEGAAEFTLFGVQLVKSVEANEGHLLFSLTDEFYTEALKCALNELEPLVQCPEFLHCSAALSRLEYTMRRMWMLGRKAEGEPSCPNNTDVQRALLLTLGAIERLDNNRALTLRLLKASDVLLRMTRGVLQRERPALCTASAHVGDCAARVFALCLVNLC